MEHVNIGDAPDDGAGDSLREAFEKINRNFDEILEVLARRSLDAGAVASGWPGEFVARHLSDTPPNASPPFLGAIWVDTSSGSVFISTGTGSIADWRRVSLSDLG